MTQNLKPTSRHKSSRTGVQLGVKPSKLSCAASILTPNAFTFTIYLPLSGDLRREAWTARTA